ncbi:MAG TPA: MBL fold metallo-hydrolase [Opitutaceae bacterium]|jgi:glyoxylase-like metal-dependent hydrolase (beta-lactamase superfamily II)
MPRIPIEDTFADIIAKAQRGLGVADVDLCKKAEVSLADLKRVKSGEVDDAVLRRVARHLRLSPNALEDLAHSRWYPEAPVFPHGFAIFNTKFEDMAVNSYLVWDGRSKGAAAFDTGADCSGVLDTIKSEKLRLQSVFITHTHDDHVADLKRLAGETGAQVWASEREPVDYPGAQTFKENAHFHVGTLSIKALSTWGHSQGQTTFFVTGLSYPLAVVGDSLFAGSMGGSKDHYLEQHRNDAEKILTLQRDTVLACGHGPLTTVGQERRHNPFFST